MRPPGVLRLPGAGAAAHPALVAVPGLGLSTEVPARALRLLTGPSTCIALPGYGLPVGRGTALHPGALADDLLRRTDALDVHGPVLLGHSASCQVVVEAALRRPDGIAGLVLVGPTTDPRADRWPRIAARWLRTAAWERPGQVPLLVRDYHRTGLGGMARVMDAARRHRIDRALARVGCPVLVVRGRHDRIAPADWVEGLADAAPHGRAVTLPAGAHMVPITHPAALAAEVGAFVAGLRPQRSR